MVDTSGCMPTSCPLWVQQGLKTNTIDSLNSHYLLAVIYINMDFFSPTSTLPLAYSRMCAICILYLQPVYLVWEHTCFSQNESQNGCITTQKDDGSYCGKKAIYYLGVGPLRKGLFMSQIFQSTA